MPFPLCATCGTQFAESDAPPATCPVCEDERQWVPASGQRWTTLERLRETHRGSYKREEPGLMAIGTTPDFAIGQRAFLVRGSGGTVLWDCVPLIDDATVDIVRGLGAPAAIAISHPHYYSTMVEWSRALGGIPVHLHEDDRRWVMRPDPCIRFWRGETMELAPGMTLVRCGGHFAGGAVLHWADGAGGRGALLSGDVIQVAPDLRTVSFLRSYPNMLPLPSRAVRRIARAVEPYAFDRVHGAFWGRTIASDGSAVVARSAENYCRWVDGEEDEGA
ncbi:MAG: beta-lactamase domain protein [Gemmatimonadetes bacterium]|nr:beta-lactamase domain protein [Gemmatimonadota bacterium]